MELPAYIRERVPLAGLTTFGIGGPARWLAEPADREQLADSLATAERLGAPVLFLGGGSNLLVADAGVEAMVIRLASSGEFGLATARAEEPLVWQVGAAAPLPALVAAVARIGVVGLETLSGIPGSVGGAVAMNCGGREGGIGQFVIEAETVSLRGESASMKPPELAFRYRGSTLKGLLAINFIMKFKTIAEPADVLNRMREYRAAKAAVQPLGQPSAGCVFKNPSGLSAGMLLDQAGCKGMREGGAVVSERHANFIVTEGQASCRDVAVLAVRMREAAARRHGINLEPEIVVWGEEPAFSLLHEEPRHVDD